MRAPRTAGLRFTVEMVRGQRRVKAWRLYRLGHSPVPAEGIGPSRHPPRSRTSPVGLEGRPVEPPRGPRSVCAEGARNRRRGCGRQRAERSEVSAAALANSAASPARPRRRGNRRRGLGGSRTLVRRVAGGVPSRRARPKLGSHPFVRWNAARYGRSLWTTQSSCGESNPDHQSGTLSSSPSDQLQWSG